MSTIKSSAENLTLNADGANNDIKFQSNGSEVASIDQAGTVTATTFTGAATDATKLPLAGGSMTNMLWVTGTNANNANNVGLGIWGGTTSQGIYARGNAASTNSFGLDSTGTTTFTQAGTERVKISSAGVLSASAGIELGSGLDATAANTLDDYEQGTWTPTLTIGGTVGYGTREGTYTKVGNLVNATFAIVINSISSLSSTVGISGFPFTVRGDSTADSSPIQFGIVRSLATDYPNLRGYLGAGGTASSLSVQATNAGHTGLPGTAITASTILYGSVVYNST